MLSFFVYAAYSSMILTLLVYKYFHVPKGLPNVPTVPVYVTLAGLWSGLGQDEIYDRRLRKPLETHGAVKIWVQGGWRILITRPDLLTSVFRDEDLYAKVGNMKRAPWTVISAIIGDNILPAHGDKCRLFASIMKPGLQKMHHHSGLLLDKSREFIDLLIRTQAEGPDGGILVDSLIQRFTLAAMGESLLDLDLGVSSSPVVKCSLLIDKLDSWSSWTSNRWVGGYC